MAVCKKEVKQNKKPKENYILQGGNPEKYNSQSPSWNFSSCDKEYCEFSYEKYIELFWIELLPYFQNMEKQTWNEILVKDKKKNHSIEVSTLNKIARDRLVQLCVEEESIISLRLSGTHRIYGYIVRAVFHILWIDFEHGDNSRCVCRSNKKHT